MSHDIAQAFAGSSPSTANDLSDGPVLVDKDLLTSIAAGSLRVDPFEPDMVRPAALSLRLGATASVLRCSRPVDTAVASTYPQLVPRPLDHAGRITIHPGEVVLAPTLERILVSEELVGVLDTISDAARLGLSVVLAQQVSPGFGAPSGAVLTLEIVSRLPVPVHLHPGTRICNLLLLRCRAPDRSYSSRRHNHSDDDGATASRLAGYVADRTPTSY